MVKKSAIKFSKQVTKDQFQDLFQKFLDKHGYMTKLNDKWSIGPENPIVAGYLVRAEIPEFEDEYVAVTFVQAKTDVKRDKTSRFLKSKGINKVLVGGNRRLKQILKSEGTLDNFKSESLLDHFLTPNDLIKLFTEKLQPEEFNVENIEKYYHEFYDYVRAFENKIHKYYGDKQVKIVVIV